MRSSTRTAPPPSSTSARAALPHVFAGADPPDHTEHRKLFFPELVQRKMNALADDVLSLTDDLLDDVLRHERVDAAAGLANPLPLRIMAERVVGFRGVDMVQPIR